jgi:hypothetical protein
MMLGLELVQISHTGIILDYGNYKDDDRTLIVDEI